MYFVTGMLFVAQKDLISFMRNRFDICFTDYRPERPFTTVYFLAQHRLHLIGKGEVQRHAGHLPTSLIK